MNVSEPVLLVVVQNVAWVIAEVPDPVVALPTACQVPSAGEHMTEPPASPRAVTLTSSNVVFCKYPDGGVIAIDEGLVVVVMALDLSVDRLAPPPIVLGELTDVFELPLATTWPEASEVLEAPAAIVAVVVSDEVDEPSVIPPMVVLVVPPTAIEGLGVLLAGVKSPLPPPEIEVAGPPKLSDSHRSGSRHRASRRP